jgi:hypothetical protein
MNEYEAKIRSTAEYIRTMRANSGATSNTLVYTLLSVLYAKNKLTEHDVDVIFTVEKDSTISTLRSYFQANFGDPTFELKNEKELEDVQKVCVEGIAEVQKYVKEVSSKIKTKKQKKKDEALKAQGIEPEEDDEEEDET